MDPHLMSQLTALLTVVMIDIVLAGDNAVVVGTAAAGLPPKQQRQVIVIGSALALVARILFALVAVQLLAIIGLVLAGGLLLLWVAWKMWRELRHHGREVEDAEALAKSRVTPKTFRSAVTQVAVADISMSLDNVLAVAGAARDHPYIMIFGLGFSIALMAVAAGFIARLIDRYRWVAYIGLGIILIVAGRMIWEGLHEVVTAVGDAGAGRPEEAPAAAH
jgi:YjbE family integral membrane protein